MYVFGCIDIYMIHISVVLVKLLAKHHFLIFLNAMYNFCYVQGIILLFAAVIKYSVYTFTIGT